ncbi:MAG: cupin domain-containing protein [Sphingobacteriaceae bacterium]|nr:cupin domain-containing protein [Sphingobacteriaceae bacterium]
MKFFLLIPFLFLGNTKVNAQKMEMNTDTIGNNSKTDNIYSRFLFGDSLSSTFCIVIKKGVKAHKHQFHSENIVVLDGEANMQVGDVNWKIKKGDAFFIPKNTVHSAQTIGNTPLKVLSIQSPLFDGTDRIMIAP